MYFVYFGPTVHCLVFVSIFQCLLSVQFTVNATKITTKFTQSLWPPETSPPAQFSQSNYLAFPFRIGHHTTPIDVKETINRNCVVGRSICDKLNCAATQRTTINMAKTEILPLQISNSLFDHIKSKVASDVAPLSTYARTYHVFVV